MKKITLIIFVFIFVLPLYAQEENEHPDLTAAKNVLATNPPLAIQYGTKGINSIGEDPNLKGNFAKTIGTAYYYLGKLDSCKYWWELSLQQFEKIGGKEEANAHNNMGVIYLRMGEIDSSFNSHQSALKIRTKVKDTAGLGNSYINLGALDRMRGNYESALTYYFSALKIYEYLDDVDKISEAYNSLGLIYMAIKDYENSLDYLKKSLEIKTNLGNQQKIGKTLNNIASVYHESGDYDKAEEYYLKAYEIFENSSDKRMIAGITNNLGIIYKEKEDHQNAITYYTTAAEQFEALEDKEGLAMVYTNLGSIYYIIEEYATAAKAFEKAKAVADDISSAPMQINITKGLSKVYSKLGKYKEAHEYLESYQEMNDSIFSNTLAERTAELREQYESEKQAKQIVLLENESLEQAAKAKQRQFVTWISISFSIVVILFLVFIINRNNLKRKILQVEKERYKLHNELKEIDLNNRDRKITSLATNTMEKDKLIEAVLGELDEVNFESNSKTLKTEQIKRQLKNVINVDEAWNKFKLHFETVHPNFFKKLKEKYPKLTQNDLRHCAYIKMNLNSKEIGMFLNIMPKSVKMNRYRLKKKLGLEDSEDIYEFLKDF
ncbi:tetratricopeptide repeat protein [Paracrocinitomix mangrovi]|uniref:tetratricopeptide repeat protein n=1 Tax=Paracrocinitomix mangrovi TaxID=2862509 RepID=UPI001C8E320B|nr:tetratricopeptide repeat protein [Paracrocinitomix mangrovi]UKN01122.1 tetratricopeptide repeat protein [Paracrocinitomix mangrovi]